MDQSIAPVQQGLDVEGLPGKVKQEADVVRHEEVEQAVKLWTISRTVRPHWLVEVGEFLELADNLAGFTSTRTCGASSVTATSWSSC